jgi:hypothetical protein
MTRRRASFRLAAALFFLFQEAVLMSAPDNIRLLAVLDSLPDRSAEIQKLLPDERYKDARSFPPDGRPYKVWTIFRSPPAPCSTKEHLVAVATHTLVLLSGKKLKLLKIDEDFLHEVRFHGASFTPEQVSFLEIAGTQAPKKGK